MTAQSTQADATVNRTYSLSRTVEATGQRADATLDWASTDWIINGRFVRELTAETRDWQQLTLTFRSTREIVQDVLRPLDQNAGKTSIITQADGSFRVADRSSGSNSVVATAPTGREDVRPITEWLVEEYSDTIIDQAGDRYEVTVELMSRESKRIREQYDDADAITVTPEDWLFEFDTGAFATSRIQYDIERSGSDGVETLLLTPSLTPRQVRILEENASKLEAVTIREVPDGANFVDDAAAENTVELTVPDGVDGADSGAYAIMEWETEWLNDAFYRVSLEMAPIQ